MEHSQLFVQSDINEYMNNIVRFSSSSYASVYRLVCALGITLYISDYFLYKSVYLFVNSLLDKRSIIQKYPSTKRKKCLQIDFQVNGTCYMANILFGKMPEMIHCFCLFAAFTGIYQVDLKKKKERILFIASYKQQFVYIS